MTPEPEVPQVLIVDDEPANIQTLSGVLGEDYRTFFATNGADALTIAAREQPDLVLLDILMPEMDGHEVCRRLQEDPATEGIPVIFVTAKDQEEDEEKGLALGGVDYITKPIRAPIVKARVDTHVRLKRYRDKLERMSWIDGLTGLANRRRFDEALAREWERTRRDEAPLSVILMDVDHFKGFNDNYGHQAGDDCLQEVARALADTVSRPADLVARYGGEEFVCLLPGTDCAGAEQLAEGIRAAVADLGIRHEHSSAADHVTLSLGVACTVPDGERRPQELSQQADENLYTAKESGRNRVYGSPAGR